MIKHQHLAWVSQIKRKSVKQMAHKYTHDNTFVSLSYTIMWHSTQLGRPPTEATSHNRVIFLLNRATTSSTSPCFITFPHFSLRLWNKLNGLISVRDFLHLSHDPWKAVCYITTKEACFGASLRDNNMVDGLVLKQIETEQCIYYLL